MLRQWETSELLFGHTDLPIVVDERLRQIDKGPIYTGMDSRQAKPDYLSYKDIKGPFFYSGEQERPLLSDDSRGKCADRR